MALADSEKMKAILEIGKMEHDEIKILYQFVIGAVVSISVAALIAVFQRTTQLIDAAIFLIAFYEGAVIIYFLIKKQLNRVREEMIRYMWDLGGNRA